jgi:hypothetical protein
VSRRTVLRGLAATVAAATGLARAGQVVAYPDAAVTPFRHRAPASALEDLKRRLVRTRWPEQETAAGWSQGVPITKLKALVEYWRTGYDWRRCEARLNGFPQYRTEIDGLGIHFLHVRSREANALPILITHGWPGSVIEFFKIIEPLTNPTAHGGRAEDAFHVVAPSLPGLPSPTNRPGAAGTMPALPGLGPNWCAASATAATSPKEGIGALSSPRPWHSSDRRGSLGFISIFR